MDIDLPGGDQGEKYEGYAGRTAVRYLRTSLWGGGDVGPVTLNATGEYRLRVFGYGDATGTYAFELRLA
jgi:hypothetical protein